MNIKSRLFLILLTLLVAVTLQNCKPKKDAVAYQKHYLNTNFGCVTNSWQVKYNGSWYDATVPGNVHSDLLTNKLISDPFYRDNETNVQWVSDSVWEYRLFFDNNCGKDEIFDHNELVFEGLDTYAEVFLNGEKMLCKSGDSLPNNMFRKWTFELPDNLREKDNELIVRFLPSTTFDSISAAALSYQLPDNRVFTRKAQYENGWDWGPKLITCGIWKDVYIERWNGMKINDFCVNDKEPSFNAARPWITSITLEIEADKIASSNLQIEITDDEGYYQKIVQKVNARAGLNVFEVPVTIENPKLWWPNGAGDQHLYYYSAVLLNDDSEITTPMLRSHGLRTVRLEQKADSIGESFQFYVNEKPFFMRGVNWIPASSYPGTLAASNGDDVYAELLQYCKDANMNMLRVWGGGIYEHDAFYNYCDQLGLLVWQDFMFACNIYPADKQFCENLKIEAEEQVKRLRNHPSIAIFCGNNEVHNGLEDWGWQKQFGYSDQLYSEIYANYDKIFNKILPEVCKKYLPSSTYIHSSPTYGWGHEECTTHGCSHYWGVWWGELPFEIWKSKTGRFMTEYGFQSYPEMATIKDFTNASDRHLSSPVMKNHQKHGRGIQIITKAIIDLYGNPDTNNLERFAYVSQLTQSDGIAQAVETHRIQRERCSGTLVWQLNDCWPVASWSCIDYFGRPKALYYKLQKLYQNVVIASEKDDDIITFYIVNDDLNDVKGTFKYKIVSNKDGNIIDSVLLDVEIPTYASKSVISCQSPKNVNPANVHVVAEFHSDNGKIDREYLTYFVKPKLLSKYRDAISINTEYDGQFATITLQSKSLKKGVFLEENNGLAVKYSDNYFDLRPNEKKKIRVDYSGLDKKPTFTVRAY